MALGGNTIAGGVMFEYQERNRFFAQVSSGMEDLAAEELSQLGARGLRPGFRGISLEADRQALYRVNYCSRLVTRVLAPLTTFPCHSTGYLYRKAKSLPWDAFLSPRHTFAIFSHVSHSKITHSQYAALCVKDAIADSFQERLQKRPDVRKIDPDVWINLHIENDRATINFDTSGGSLHRRGYREETIEAPIQETVAAAMIKLSGWDGTRPLYDPMAGSGTLLCEALMAYCRIPPGRLRRQFGFMLLPDFDEGAWISVKKEADQQIRELPKGLISGSDISFQAVHASRRNCMNLPYGEGIGLSQSDFREIDHLEGRLIVCNPPYGIRLGRKADMAGLYKDFGDFLKKRCKNSQAYIYAGNRELIPKIGLRPAWKRPLRNGPLDGRLCKFEIY